MRTVPGDSLLESVGDEFDGSHFLAFSVQEDGHHIEAAFSLLLVFFFQVVFGQLGKFPALGGSQPFLGVAKVQAGPALDLDENQGVRLQGYYIDFTQRAAIVHFQDLIPCFPNVRCRQFFPHEPQTFFFHGGYSANPSKSKDLRCQGHGPYCRRASLCSRVG